MARPFHHQFLTIVSEIEKRFPVAMWKSRDLEIWPLARMDLYLDMFWASVGADPPSRRPFPFRSVARLAAPLKNMWRSRRDLAHWVARPGAADAILLGDGVSLDRQDGAAYDRYGEPIIAALERRGLSTFLMQDGDLSRLPWHRPTFPANTIASRGVVTRFAPMLDTEILQHDALQRFLLSNQIIAPSLTRAALERRAGSVLAMAAAFERILRVVRPRLAFVVTYYAGLGPAFLLACRRQKILSVDLQHCPQEGAHKAYGWTAVPDTGYAALPSVFWTWTARDAMYIRRWASKLPVPWHRSLHGGHTQLASFLDDNDAATIRWDEKFRGIGLDNKFEREILVALQPIGGFRDEWDALAARIEAAPSTWRWWIRRHPASASYQDVEYHRLVSLRKPNVIVDEASSLPLPALLRNVSVIVSRFSGASAEAAAFGVPAFFLSEEARGQFSELIDRGLATVIEISALNARIEQIPRMPTRPPAANQPDLHETLRQLEVMAGDYARLYDAAAPLSRISPVE
jgi:hypothetical protein